VLGEAATPAILAAWGEAYWFLADILIAREAAIYEEHSAAPGGWKGWRDFVVTDKIEESDVITSFVLAPADGGPVLRHQPGQYLTFWLDLPGQPPQKRNYSISSAPGGSSYRISVKREQSGGASGWLHRNVEKGTHLKVGAPAGDFVLPADFTRPVVLLSGGVGQTPLLSMMHAAAGRPVTPPVHFVHGAQSGATHALQQEARALAAGSNGRIRVTTFYERPREEDRQGEHFDHAGTVTPEWLAQNTPLSGADYYLCGPRPFLRSFVTSLLGLGVPAAQIHYEFFGPTDELLAA
jgi:nitric oxide dioxygenase